MGVNMNEPVAWIAYDEFGDFMLEATPEGDYPWQPLYTHPHSDKSVKAKTLTPLTDEEIKDQFMWKCPRSGRLEIFTYAVRWAEERHKRNEQ